MMRVVIIGNGVAGIEAALTVRARYQDWEITIVSEESEYQRGTFYNSAKFMDVEYTTAGLVNFNLPGETDWFHEEQGGVRSTTRLVLQDEKVVGFNLLGRRWNHEVLVRWIEERRAPDYVLDHLHEALYDAEFTPPLEIPGHPRRRPSLLKRLVG